MLTHDPSKEEYFQSVYKSGYLNRYTCEFDFIPNILPDFYVKGEIDDYIMTHPIEWKIILLKKGVNSDFGMDEINVEKVEKYNETTFIYTFPRPQKTPHCFYALLIFDKDKNWNYYTLELDYGSSTIFKDGGGFICGQKGFDHLNYAERCIENLCEFQKKVKKIRESEPRVLLYNLVDNDSNQSRCEIF